MCKFRQNWVSEDHFLKNTHDLPFIRALDCYQIMVTYSSWVKIESHYFWGKSFWSSIPDGCKVSVRHKTQELREIWQDYPKDTSKWHIDPDWTILNVILIAGETKVPWVYAHDTLHIWTKTKIWNITQKKRERL